MSWLSNKWGWGVHGRVDGGVLDGERRRSNLDRLSAYRGSGARLDDPLSPAPKQLGVLHYVEEPAFSDQLLEIGSIVSAKFLVFEVYPEPLLRAAVINIKSTRFWISWRGKKNEKSFRKMQPLGDCVMLSDTKQTVDGPSPGFVYV